MSIVLIEAILLSMCGGGAGVLLGHGLMAAASPIVEARTGVSLGFFRFDFVELLLLAGLLILAPVVGFLPAWAAYRTDVAKALAGSK
jgi:putative ABC transport system permease protein